MNFLPMLLLATTQASTGFYADTVRVYYPSGRASYYFDCDTVEDASSITAHCNRRFDNQPGVNPSSGTSSPLSVSVYDVGGQWSYQDTCILTGTYAVPVPSALGYILECQSDDLIFGDTFDGLPFD